MLDLHTLEQFVTFYHTGTLVEAAERLHISQSTLTRGMQRMEAEFEVPLFERTKNSITLTEAGQMATADAEMILRQYDNMLNRVRDFDKRNRTIMIGSCAPVPITNLVEQLTALFSTSTIAAELKNIPHLFKGLAEHTYQIIVLPEEPHEQDLVSKPLCSESLFFSLHKDHPFADRESLSVKDMNGENMLLFQDIGFWHDLVVEKMPDSRFLMQSERYTFAELARNSTLSMFTTDALPFSIVEENRVQIPIVDPEFNVTYHAVCRKENHRLLASITTSYRQ